MSDGSEAATTGGEETASSQEVSSEAKAPAQSGQQAGAQTQNSTQMSSKDAQAARQEVINKISDGDMDKLVTLKINGKEETMPLKEALKVSRLEKASQAKLQEAAQIAKQAQGLIQMAKANPKAFFQQTGMDPYEFAEATLAEKYEMMQLTPEQKRLMEYEQKVKHYEEREKQEKEMRDQQARQAEESKVRGELEQEIVEAWKDSGLPRSKYFAARISAEMLSSIAQKKAGLREDTLQAKEAAAIVKDSFVNELRDILLSTAKTDVGTVQKLLGDDLMKLLRDYDVKRVTGQAASSNSKSQPNRPASAASGKSSKQSKPMSEKDWKEYWKNL